MFPMKSIKQIIISISKSTTVNYIVLDGKVGLMGLLFVYVPNPLINRIVNNI